MARTSGFLQARLARLGPVLEGYVTRGEVPGVVAGVCRGGEAHVYAYGHLGLNDPAPMPRNAIFRVQSMTKAIAAVVALQLVEETKLRLDDPVDAWLPELADRRVLARPDGPVTETVAADRPVSLRDLLTLRPGFGYRPGAEDWPVQLAYDDAELSPGPSRKTISPDAYMERLGALPLAFQPGTRWMYHAGFDVLNILLARAGGKPVAELFAERVFEPLGMRDTGFHVPEDKLPRLTTAYRAEGGKLVVADPAAGGEYAAPPPFPDEVASTVDDWLVFGRMLRDGGRYPGGRLLARPTVELMVTDQITPGQKAASPFFGDFWAAAGWGMGVSPVTRRDVVGGTPGRFGWDGGFGTSFFCDPLEDLVGVVMVQRAWDDVFTRLQGDFSTLTYQALAD